jgi:hypothetical protein
MNVGHPQQPSRDMPGKEGARKMRANDMSADSAGMSSYCGYKSVRRNSVLVPKANLVLRELRLQWRIAEAQERKLQSNVMRVLRQTQ